ncbi:uncharacterized protein UTRI_01373_B [Ustilago trichophora]|uniref:Proteasome assembly chaperone 3 n=1 Tax=Ustilago trichophora TaxID=86804 RepID=A0A5C3E386_9BASI|nr:uncharacterized protein UTRI_01373_B [Ustilago trichophora]
MMSTNRPNTGISALKVEVTPIKGPVIPTSTLTVTISGHPTTVIAQSFADRIFITVTQLNKFGVLYQAVTSSAPSSSAGYLDFEPALKSTLPPPLPTTSVSKLVGTEPSPAHMALYQLYVAQIASIVKHSQNGQDGRPLIVSLALKSSAKEGEKQAMAFGEDDDEDDESFLMTSPEERERFMAIMKAVQECRVW